MKLFDDQIETLNKVYDEYRSGKRHVLLQASTGSGKSVMASALIKKSTGNIWFVVPRRELVKQMRETFNDYGINHGVICPGYDYSPTANVQIVSLNTIVRKLEGWVKLPNRLVIDETHFGSKTLDTLISWGKSIGCLTLGLSASPARMDGKGLGCWYDSMVCGPSTKWLIENKRLARYRPFSPDHVDLSKIKITAGDYNQSQLSEMMMANRVLIGNAVKHYKQHAFGKRGVTFGVGINHSKMLCQAYRDAGIPAAHMDGDTPDAERTRIAKAFARREILQLCNSDLLTFGYDLSSASGIKDVVIECLTDCQPTKSLPKILQKWGRALRYSDEPHLFFDHANNFETHGYPDDEREWTLEDTPRSTRKSGEQNINVKTCMPDANGPGCYFSHKLAPVCPNCGHVYEIKAREIEEIEGELKEIILQRKKESRMEVGKAKTLDDLIKIGHQRGYARGWAYNMAKAKGIL